MRDYIIVGGDGDGDGNGDVGGYIFWFWSGRGIDECVGLGEFWIIIFF